MLKIRFLGPASQDSASGEMEWSLGMRILSNIPSQFLGCVAFGEHWVSLTLPPLSRVPDTSWLLLNTHRVFYLNIVSQRFGAILLLLLFCVVLFWFLLLSFCFNWLGLAFVF